MNAPVRGIVDQQDVMRLVRSAKVVAGLQAEAQLETKRRIRKVFGTRAGRDVLAWMTLETMTGIRPGGDANEALRREGRMALVRDIFQALAEAPLPKDTDE